MARSALGLDKNQQLIAIALVIAIVVLLATTVIVGFNGKDSIMGSGGDTQTAQPTAIPTPVIPSAETIFSTVTGFVPETVTVKKGAEVNILNFSEDQLKIVTADGNPVMNLGEVEENDEVVVKLTEVGTYNYQNEYRPEEKGQIIVVE